MIQPMCQESMADVKKMTERINGLSQPNVRKMSSCQSVSTRNEEGYKQNRRFHTSLTQLQAKIEVENQQVQETIKPLLDAENGFLKELECFLSQREVADLRRKELLHKRWTERVWSPLQRRVEEHVSSCRRRQSMCPRHCNAKGFVSPETYDPQEYNHFLLGAKNLQCFKDRKTHDEKSRSTLRTIDLCAVFSVCAGKNRLNKLRVEGTELLRSGFLLDSHTNKKFSTHPDSKQSTSEQQGAADRKWH